MEQKSMTQKAPINWVNTLFLTLTPLGALVLVPWYGFSNGYTLFEWACFTVYLMVTGLSITGGYHRLFSHKSYKAHFLVRLAYAIGGAAACQNSILSWSSDHRVHHRFVDDYDKDPYSASRGFWYSHMGWVMRNHPRYISDFSNCKDLLRDPIVVWQHKYYWPLAVITNGVIPLALGYMTGRPYGVFMLAFFLRVVLNHHFTFFINSLAHIWGRRPYSDEDSSCDNGLLALFTYGEGYHNFHHTFQHDYRNGIRWWHFDPAKWLIRCCSWFGLARDLRRASKIQIEKARLKMQLKRAMLKVDSGGEAAKFRATLEQSYQQCVAALNEWARVKRDWYNVKKEAFTERLEKVELRDRYLELHYALKSKRRQWRLLLADLAAV